MKPDTYLNTEMTLRDYFAAQALLAVYSRNAEVNYWCGEYSTEEAWRLVAERAYEIADAMMAARER